MSGGWNYRSTSLGTNSSLPNPLAGLLCYHVYGEIKIIIKGATSRQGEREGKIEVKEGRIKVRDGTEGRKYPEINFWLLRLCFGGVKQDLLMR